MLDDEIQQSIALKWLHEFLEFAQDVVVPFTPRMIPAVLPNLAHHAPDIQSAAIKTNQLLFNVIQSLSAVTTPVATTLPVKAVPSTASTRNSMVMPSISPPLSSSPIRGLDSSGDPTGKLRLIPPILEQGGDTASSASSIAEKDVVTQGNITLSRPASPPHDTNNGIPNEPEEVDPLDYNETVSALTFQFLSEHEETRVAALKWLIMLHQKVPHKVNPS